MADEQEDARLLFAELGGGAKTITVAEFKVSSYHESRALAGVAEGCCRLVLSAIDDAPFV